MVESDENDSGKEIPVPDFVPEPSSGDVNNCNGNEVFLERNEENINGDINCQSSPIVEEVISDFVPAVNFNFEQPILEDPVNDGYTKVVKRKKCKKSELGRPSTTYTSSNESQRIVKNPKRKTMIYLGLMDYLV
ncbi:hypothetical protein Hanom_Chr08g00726881 [Helianthus anomalus]